MPRNWTYSDPDQGDLNRACAAWQQHCETLAPKLLPTPSKRICRALCMPDGQRGIELHNGDGLIARYLVTVAGVTLLERTQDQVDE